MSWDVLRLIFSPKDRGPGKNKRKWKEEEDDALIEVLKDLVNGGTLFKIDNRFKIGFLNTVAEKLKAKLPESNLKAQPHVHSRLRHFKGIYNVVQDMVIGSCTSGFGWDPETKFVVAEKEVWKAYAQELRKMVRASDNLVKGLPEVASIFGKKIRATSSNISRAIDLDVELSEKRSKLNEELANLGLTTMERHRAFAHFGFTQKEKGIMGDERVKEEALQILGLFQALPRLREMPSMYPHAKGILYALKDKGIDVAIASRSPTPDVAKTFLGKLGIQSMFVAQVKNMGVTSILVGNGVNCNALRQGLVEFSQNSRASDKTGSSGKNKQK
ncbi:hypothetical protein Cgig2_019450 [Carnegiea gigantea]|uniref:Myb/SANT-like domain-containing protein n=1 Tax=Carnegiea gigantea TaxID=171969 RepID=A0A9Q1KRE2_9CARY|nr:hypothetical protein Cgig2_019450 [Carnegiea gigantea]